MKYNCELNNKELKLSDDIKVKLKKDFKKVKKLREFYKLYCYAIKYFKIQFLNFFN